MIRLAFVIPTLDQSGAERQLALLACGLPRDRFEIRVFALNRGGYFADILEKAGIPVEILQKRFRFDPLTWWRLRKAIRRFQPQLVQSFLFSANAYVRLPGICPAGTFVIVSERCVDSWKSAWQLSLDRRLASRTSAMTANSASVAEFYRDVGVQPDLISVIPNGIKVPAENANSADTASRDQIRQELGLMPTDRVVCFAGRLARQKRLPDLIWSFQLLHQLVENAKLVLIGDGPERDRLAELAVKLGCRDKIVFAGHRMDAYKLMAGMDVFCLPSEFEGMSNSLMEAMSLGLPVVVSDIAANRELVTHEQTGLVFPLGKSPEMTKALRQLLTDDSLAKRLALAARQLLVKHHSVEQLVSRHVQLYERLLAQRRV